jgi:hypothetical protein
VTYFLDLGNGLEIGTSNENGGMQIGDTPEGHLDSKLLESRSSSCQEIEPRLSCMKTKAHVVIKVNEEKNLENVKIDEILEMCSSTTDQDDKDMTCFAQVRIEQVEFSILSNEFQFLNIYIEKGCGKKSELNASFMSVKDHANGTNINIYKKFVLIIRQD